MQTFLSQWLAIRCFSRSSADSSVCLVLSVIADESFWAVAVMFVIPSCCFLSLQTIAQIITSRLFREVENVIQINRTSKRPLEQVMSMIVPRKQLQLSALVSQLLQSKPPKKFPEEERCGLWNFKHLSHSVVIVCWFLRWTVAALLLRFLFWLP